MVQWYELLRGGSGSTSVARQQQVQNAKGANGQRQEAEGVERLGNGLDGKELHISERRTAKWNREEWPEEMNQVARDEMQFISVNTRYSRGGCRYSILVCHQTVTSSPELLDSGAPVTSKIPRLAFRRSFSEPRMDFTTPSFGCLPPCGFVEPQRWVRMGVWDCHRESA
jgi:hypothetical protein